MDFTQTNCEHLLNEIALKFSQKFCFSVIHSDDILVTLYFVNNSGMCVTLTRFSFHSQTSELLKTENLYAQQHIRITSEIEEMNHKIHELLIQHQKLQYLLSKKRNSFFSVFKRNSIKKLKKELKTLSALYNNLEANKRKLETKRFELSVIDTHDYELILAATGLKP